jgi:hypothetical protein
MATLFLACAVLGGLVVLLQLALALLGHDADHDLAHDAAEGFQLVSVRSLAAAVAFFGVAGRAVLAAGLGGFAATVIALPVGLLAGAGIAFAMRLIGRAESDGAVRIDGALGLPARVHVRVPGERVGAGKIHLTLQDRMVELRAVTAHDALPTGTPVVVVDVVDGETVEVAPTPHPEMV